MATLEPWINTHLKKGYDTHTIKEAMRQKGYLESDLGIVDDLYLSFLKEKNYFRKLKDHINLAKVVAVVGGAFVLGIGVSILLYTVLTSYVLVD